jgi:SlyX protein
MTDHDGPEPEEIANLRDRLAALESHVAHQDAACQDMSDMIARQWEDIDRLIRTVKLLHDQLAVLQPAPEAKKPPHY